MSTSLPFARFIQLIKAIDQLPIPSELYNRHRMLYFGATVRELR